MAKATGGGATPQVEAPGPLEGQEVTTGKGGAAWPVDLYGKQTIWFWVTFGFGLILLVFGVV